MGTGVGDGHRSASRLPRELRNPNRLLINTQRRTSVSFYFTLIAYRRIQRAYFDLENFIIVSGASLAVICTGDRAVVESRDRVQDAPQEGAVVALGGATSSQHVSNTHE